MILCQRFNQYTAITRIVEMRGNLTYHNYALQAKRAYVVNLHAWQKCMQNRQYAICISSGYSSQNIQYWLPR